MRQQLTQAHSVVIKIGSGVLVREGTRFDRGTFCRLVEQLAALATSGRRLTIVSSGAVALGRGRLGHTERPDRERNLARLQALAAVGQSSLMQLYESELAHYALLCGQVLLTRSDLDNRTRYLNARHTLRELALLNVIPIINENDTVTVDELRFGDNDALAARVACLLEADLLVILSDVDAVYTANPRLHPNALPIREIASNDPTLEAVAGGTTDHHGVGTGGMITKLEAARIAARLNIPTVITSGKATHDIPRVFAGHDDVGTLIIPAGERQSGRKAWIETLLPLGRLYCDEGAVAALTQRGKSLLPSGLTRVEGDFREGDPVDLCDLHGGPFARGLAAYNHQDMSRIVGAQSEDIVDILGFCTTKAAIHRDDMVLL